MRNANTITLDGTVKQSAARAPRKTRRKLILPVLLALILALGGGGYWYWTQAQAASTAAAAAQTSSAAKTSTVKTGSLTISAAGSGTLVATQTTALSFSTAGTLAEVNVAVGDTVQQGQVLARLADTRELQSNIDIAEQNLISAQAALATLKASGPANIAAAQLSLATAQKAVTDASSEVVQKGDARCDATTIDLYYQKYMLAQNHVNEITAASDGTNDYYVTYTLPAKNSAAQAYSTYIWCNGYTDYEVDSSHANLSIAQAALASAKTRLASLQQNNGVDPLELASAEKTAASAQTTLEDAKEALDGTSIKAPYAGVVLAVAGQAGDTAGTSTFISIADLSRPTVKFYLDEADMGKLALGQTATVSFDAIADRSFSGKVTQINPALQTVNSYQVVQGLITLDLSGEKNLPTLATGMNASVEVISGKAENALLVPVAAVHDLGDGVYSVFVVDASGKTQMKVVEVGLQDAASAQITSGLSAGDVVTTGIVQIK